MASRVGDAYETGPRKRIEGEGFETDTIDHSRDVGGASLE
jgi:hypothetical protein